MPELPEIQTIITDLQQVILNKKITNINVKLPKIIKNKLSFFKKELLNNSFLKLQRRGKLMIFYLQKGDYVLLIHLKMTGQLIYHKKNKIIAGGHHEIKNLFNLPSKTTHIIFTFQDQAKLFYNDGRQFGYLKLIKQKELSLILDKYGVEPLSSQFTLSYLKKLFKGKKRNIKAFLLDQSQIAGLGNIYVDESLFFAKIHPQEKINSLTLEQVKKLHQGIKKILQQSIKLRGTTFNTFVDANGNRGSFVSRLKVYQKEGQKCSRCQKGIIKKIVVAGRGTRFCPICQKLNH